MIKRNINIFLVSCAALLMTACSKYLDVKPNSSILESEAYSSQAGFENHLNGVYLNLASQSLYGGMANMIAPELLAQRYMQSSPSGADIFKYRVVSSYQWGDPTTKAMFSSIWSSSYAQIANLNNILQQIDGKKQLFVDSAFNKVKGEALALRTFLYFDLLRLFGPVYSVDSARDAIPYYSTVTRGPNDYMPANQLMDSLMRDGLAARALLDPQYAYKKSFFSYHAVTAMLARMSLYRGANAQAFDFATEVIRNQPGKYGFNGPGGAATDPALSGDAVLAFQNAKLIDVHNKYFSEAITDETQLLFPFGEVLSNCFEGQTADERFRPSIFALPTQVPHTSYCIYKFSKGNLVPIIRASECYLIAAETAADPAEGLRYLNLLRAARNIRTLTDATNLNDNIRKEYMKEFWVEGQLFYYYKRKQTAAIPNNYGGAEVRMSKATYVVPLPESELAIHQPKN
ncbi:RagB/SusD family nutrient uptake outer membrane protein [Chitinophaga sp. sic0106]|uniref:RagB/SusD family nutrient uptake outer membrane protein n=1 Tax=Chitinophaga sp. sic0106 TaxID=2854785 RepID=UPI001C465FB1|nr:RagB/SusD family nutrient uptake outer membrane protein [Chitinophaga sp. sic0106]MBV7532554.1 RagB/SusD family nutrient uptake outer membrane protein [Chitinophaga sp. sic0106]